MPEFNAIAPRIAARPAARSHPPGKVGVTSADQKLLDPVLDLEAVARGFGECRVEIAASAATLPNFGSR